MIKVRRKSPVLDAIQYLGDNWREIAVDFMGLRAEFDADAPYDENGHNGNIYPSMEYRTQWLNVPKPNSNYDVLEVGDWLVREADGYLMVYGDDRFRQLYESESGTSVGGRVMDRAAEGDIAIYGAGSS